LSIFRGCAFRKRLHPCGNPRMANRWFLDWSRTSGFASSLNAVQPRMLQFVKTIVLTSLGLWFPVFSNIAKKFC
jgi:hypothetical protein